MAGILDGKKIVVMGVANKKSIAWGCTQAFLKQGAQVILTYQNDRMKRSIERFVPENTPLVECDVSEDKNVEATFKEIGEKYGKVDGLIHAIAYADKETLTNDFIDTTKAGYDLAQNISAYSLISVCRYAKEILNDPASIMTMTYFGSTRAIPNYNMMGVAKAALEANVRYLARDLGKSNIRVNAISAGALKTLAVTGIKNHKSLLDTSKDLTVNKKAVTVDEVGNLAAFLMSDMSSGLTGDIIYCDKGVHLLV